jgi:nitrogen PTS system EIIA component
MKLHLTDLMREELIFPHMEAADRDEVFRQLTGALVQEGLIGPSDREELEGAILHREEMQCTAIGERIALPHAYERSLSENLLLFARLAHPVTFSEPGGDQVEIVLLLVGPQRDPLEHLQILARITRMLKDERFVRTIRTAPDAETIYEAVREVEIRHS